MTKNSELVELRLKLDDAITYGTQKAALVLAKKYLKMAQKKKLPGEVEYFTGQVEMLKENFVTAMEHFDKAAQYNPQDGAAFNDRALCMIEIGIIDKAFFYFDMGIRVEPDFATIHHNKGWLLNNIGRYTEAIVCFKEALRLDPKRPVTYDNLADALYNLHDYKGALEAYKKVLLLLKPGTCRGIRAEIKKKIVEIEKLLQ